MFKTLVAYFSASGCTAKLVQKLWHALSGFSHLVGKKTRAVVKRALDAGANFFDTAIAYQSHVAGGRRNKAHHVDGASARI